MPWKTHLCVAAAVTTAALLAAGCGGPADDTAAGSGTGTARARTAAPGPDRAKTTPVPRASATATASPAASPGTDPGALPQTRALPGDQDAQFQTGARALWQAIVQDKPDLARPFFFPLSAYLQVKAINDPAADYRDRLLAWYALDIRAAHDHLGAHAASARFVGVDVPEGAAQWIGPGVEYNKGSYYRVYGTRLNYEIDGHDASIGVFSLISWRGEWYVVHLGPSTRPAMEGIVYDPRG